MASKKLPQIYFAILSLFLMVLLGLIIFDPTTSKGKNFIIALAIVVYIASFTISTVLAKNYQRSQFFWGALSLLLPLLAPIILYTLGTKNIYLQTEKRYGWPNFRIVEHEDKLSSIISFAVGTEELIEQKTYDPWQRIVLLLLFFDNEDAIKQVDVKQILCEYKEPVGMPLFGDIDTLAIMELVLNLEKLFCVQFSRSDIEVLEPSIANIANKLQQVYQNS